MDDTADTAPSRLPAPPPPPSTEELPEPDAAVVVRPGQLTAGWGTVFWLGWSLAAGALIAVWVSSRTTGLSTWWLGPRVDPVFIGLSLLVFVPPIGLAIAGLTHRRWLPWFGIAGGVALLAVAVGDVDRVRGYAIIEATIAAGGLLVSVACFAGMLRRTR